MKLIYLNNSDFNNIRTWNGIFDRENDYLLLFFVSVLTYKSIITNIKFM
jgi:hypothetical protein